MWRDTTSRFSPWLILGRLIVRNQTPEYVGAAQKKFAWIIGVELMVWSMNDRFSEKPYDLFGISNTEQHG